MEPSKGTGWRQEVPGFQSLGFPRELSERDVDPCAVTAEQRGRVREHLAAHLWHGKQPTPGGFPCLLPRDRAERMPGRARGPVPHSVWGRSADGTRFLRSAHLHGWDSSKSRASAARGKGGFRVWEKPWDCRAPAGERRQASACWRGWHLPWALGPVPRSGRSRKLLRVSVLESTSQARGNIEASPAQPGSCVFICQHLGLFPDTKRETFGQRFG